MDTTTNEKKDLIISAILWSVIGLLLLFIIMFLYIPKLSVKVIGVGAYQGLTGYDSTLKTHEMLIIKEKDFDDLTTNDIIVFKLKGYGDSDGLKAYKVMARPDDKYYHVHSSDSWMSFPWNITEEMYVGVVASKVPYVGAVTGFLGSWYGLGFILVNGIVIGAIVYLVKENKKEEKEQEEKE